MFMLGLSSFLTWKLGEEIRNSVEAQSQVLQAAERLENYGNVLELSIKMVVATGDSSAAARYRAVQPQLRETLQKLRTDLDVGGARAAASQVDRADLWLIAREFEALDLANQGRLEEARNIISSDDYNDHLAIYYGGIADLEDRASEHLASSERQVDRFLTVILALSLASFAVILAGAIAVWRPARTWAHRLKTSQVRTAKALAELAKIQEQLEAANQSLFEQARMDPLTGLPSRRKFNEDVERAIPEALADGSSYSVILCDVDNFKLYNDTYGHLAGDEALRLVGAALKGALGPEDRVYRYGGEEFALFVKSHSPQVGMLTAERFRAAVESFGIPHRGNATGIVTVSLGIVQIDPARNLSIGCWIEMADRALYAAKHSGRNRVAASDAMAA